MALELILFHFFFLSRKGEEEEEKEEEGLAPEIEKCEEIGERNQFSGFPGADSSLRHAIVLIAGDASFPSPPLSLPPTTPPLDSLLFSLRAGKAGRPGATASVAPLVPSRLFIPPPSFPDRGSAGEQAGGRARRAGRPRGAIGATERGDPGSGTRAGRPGRETGGHRPADCRRGSDKSDSTCSGLWLLQRYNNVDTITTEL